MRFLFISRRGASLSLAKKVADEGHIVNFFVNNLLYKVLGDGIVTKTKTSVHKGYIYGTGEEFNNSDIVIFDEVGLGEYASEIAKAKPVLGASKFADLFNDDLSYKQKVLERCKLKLGGHYLGEVIYTTGWYNGFNFIRPFHSYFKKTKFMENDLSIDTECMGCLLFYHKANKLTKETLYKLRSELKKIGYKGAITFKCSLYEDKYGINDVHFGFEYDSTYAAFEGLRQNFGETLYRMAFDSIKRVKASSDWLVATRVTIPPYPFETSEKFKVPTTIEGINSENLKHIWLRDVQLVNNSYQSANCDGFILTVTARGLTPYKAFKRTHRTIGNLKIENVQFRKDILVGMEEKYNKIKKWGWI